MNIYLYREILGLAYASHPRPADCFPNLYAYQNVYKDMGRLPRQAASRRMGAFRFLCNPNKSIRNLVLVKNLTILKISILANINPN